MHSGGLETFTTVTYGEYFQVTVRVIAGATMFAAIATGKVREATNPAAKGADEVVQQNQGRGTIWL